jgi:hypothetical protein
MKFGYRAPARSLLGSLYGIAMMSAWAGCSVPEKLPSTAEKKISPATVLSGELKPGETIYIPVAPASRPEAIPGRRTADGIN